MLWVYDDAGRLHRLQHEFQLPVYAHGERAALQQLSAELFRRKLITGGRWQRKREFWSGEELEVMQLNLSDAGHARRLRELAVERTELTFFNLDIPAAQYYLCLAGPFPLCRLTCAVDEYGYVQEARARGWSLLHWICGVSGALAAPRAPWTYNRVIGSCCECFKAFNAIAAGYALNES